MGRERGWRERGREAEREEGKRGQRSSNRCRANKKEK